MSSLSQTVPWEAFMCCLLCPVSSGSWVVLVYQKSIRSLVKWTRRLWGVTMAGDRTTDEMGTLVSLGEGVSSTFLEA